MAVMNWVHDFSSPTSLIFPHPFMCRLHSTCTSLPHFPEYVQKFFTPMLLCVLFLLSGMPGESFIICGEGLLKYYLFFIFISNPLLHENISSPAIFWISMAFSYITHSYLVLSLFHLHLFCLTPPPPDTHWTVNSCILLFFFFFVFST